MRLFFTRMFPLDEIELSDSLLVERARRGEKDGFESLFDRYYERIRQYAYRIVLEHHAADDVAQETFIRAARKLPGLEEGVAFLSWLFTIASNVARDYLRRQQSQRARTFAAYQEHSGGDRSLEGEEASTDRQSRLLRAMQALSPRQREAVALVYFENCNHAEAARRAGCAESTISWRVFLAKRTLKKLLTP